VSQKLRLDALVIWRCCTVRMGPSVVFGHSIRLNSPLFARIRPPSPTPRFAGHAVSAI
jgi:hypothetical protein